MLDSGRFRRKAGQGIGMMALHRFEELALFPPDVVMQPCSQLAEKFRVVRCGHRITHAPLRQAPQGGVLIQQAITQGLRVDQREEQTFFIIEVRPDLRLPRLHESRHCATAGRFVALRGTLQRSRLDQPVHMLPRKRLERRVTLQRRRHRRTGLLDVVLGHSVIVFRMCATLSILGRGPDHDFDEPLGLLTDCHRRIESFLGVLLRVTQEVKGRPLDVPHAEALRKAQAYFAHAAPRHTADEEGSLFPRVRAALAGDGNAGQRAEAIADLDRLHGDHARADSLHARVDELLTAWLRDGELAVEQVSELEGLVESLGSLYREHIHVEESVVFPLAGRVLSGDDLSRVGAAMRARRGLTSEQ